MDKFQAMLDAAMKSGEALPPGEGDNESSGGSTEPLSKRLKSKNFGVRRKAFGEALKDPASVPPSRGIIEYLLKNEKNVLLIKNLLDLLDKPGFVEIVTGDVSILRKCFEKLKDRKFFRGVKFITYSSLRSLGATTILEVLIASFHKEKSEKVKDSYLLLLKDILLQFGILCWNNELFLQYLNILNTFSEDKFMRKCVKETMAEINNRLPSEVKTMLKLKYPKCGWDEVEPSVSPETAVEAVLEKLLSIDTLTKKRKKKKFFKILAKMKFFKEIESLKKVKKQKKLLDFLEEKMALFNLNDYDPLTTEESLKLAKALVAFIKKSSPLLNVAVTCLKFCRPLPLHNFPDAAVVLLNKCKERKKYLVDNIHSVFKDEATGLSYVVLTERLYRRLRDKLEFKNLDVVEAYCLFVCNAKSVKREVCSALVEWVIANALTHQKPEIRKHAMGVVERMIKVDTAGVLATCEKHAKNAKIDSSRMKKIRGFAQKLGHVSMGEGGGAKKVKKKKGAAVEDIQTLVTKKKYAQIKLAQVQALNAPMLNTLLSTLSASYRYENLTKNRVNIMKTVKLVVTACAHLLTESCVAHFFEMCHTMVKSKKKAEKTMKKLAKVILDAVDVNLLLPHVFRVMETKSVYFVGRLESDFEKIKKKKKEGESSYGMQVVHYVVTQYFKDVRKEVCVSILKKVVGRTSAGQVAGWIEILKVGTKKQKHALKVKVNVDDTEPKEDIIGIIRRKITPQRKMKKEKKPKRIPENTSVKPKPTKTREMEFVIPKPKLKMKKKKKNESVGKLPPVAVVEMNVEEELKKVFLVLKQQSGSTNENAIFQSYELLKFYMQQVNLRKDFVFNYPLFTDLNNCLFFALSSPYTALVTLDERAENFFRCIMLILLGVFSNYQVCGLMKKDVLVKYLDFVFEKIVKIDQLGNSGLAKLTETVLAKILRCSNKTTVTQCLVTLLDPERRNAARSSNQPPFAGGDVYVKYVSRTLLTLLNGINVVEIDMDLVLFEIDVFFRKYPPRKHPKMVLCVRTLKAMLLKFVLAKPDIDQNFSLLRDDNSLVRTFIVDELKLATLRKSIGVVFEKIKNEDTLEQGLKELYDIKVKNPLFDMNAQLQNFSAPFRKYIESELTKMETKK